MEAGLSFIMANHGRVKENDVVFDPFVGTGIFTGLLHRRGDVAWLDVTVKIIALLLVWI